MSSCDALKRRAFTSGGIAVAATAVSVPAFAQELAAGRDAQIVIDPIATPVRFGRNISGQFLEHFHRGLYGGVFRPGSSLPDRGRDRDENDRHEVHTRADALFLAAVLNGCRRHGDEVRRACMAPVVNVRGPLYAYDKGLVQRTSFHVLRMYPDLPQPNVLATRIDSSPLTSDDKSVPAGRCRPDAQRRSPQDDDGTPQSTSKQGGAESPGRRTGQRWTPHHPRWCFRRLR